MHRPSVHHSYPSPQSMPDQSPPALALAGLPQPQPHRHLEPSRDQPVIFNHHSAAPAHDPARGAVPGYNSSLALSLGITRRPSSSAGHRSRAAPPMPLPPPPPPPPPQQQPPLTTSTARTSLQQLYASTRFVPPISRHAVVSGRYHPPPNSAHNSFSSVRGTEPASASRHSLACVVRDRQLSGHAARTHTSRTQLRSSMHPRVLIAPTSGDVEAVTHVAGTAFAIASAAKPTVTENREGNLIVAHVGARKVWSSETAHRLEVNDARFAPVPAASAPGADPPGFAVFCTVCVSIAFNGYVLSAGGSAYSPANLNGPEIHPFGQVRLTDVRTGAQVLLPADLASLPSRVATGAQSPVWPQLVALGCDDGTVVVVNVERIAGRRKRGLYAKTTTGEVGPGLAAPGVTALGFGAGHGAHLLIVGTDRTVVGDEVGPAAVVVLDVRALGKVHGPWLRTAVDGGVLVGRQEIDWPWSIAGVVVDQVDGAFAWFSTSEIEGSDRCVHRIKLHDGEGRPCTQLVIDMSVFTDLADVDVMALSHCNRYLVVGGNERIARVFDFRDPSRALALLEHEETLAEPNVYDTRFLRHSNLLVTVAGDGVVRFWDTADLSTTTPTLAEAQLGSVAASVLCAWTRRNWPALTSFGFVPNNPPDDVLDDARHAAIDHNERLHGLTGRHNGAMPWHLVPVRRGLISRVAASEDERVLVVGMEACALALGCDEMGAEDGAAAEINAVVHEDWWTGVVGSLVGGGRECDDDPMDVDGMEVDGEPAAWVDEQAIEWVDGIEKLELDLRGL